MIDLDETVVQPNKSQDNLWNIPFKNPNPEQQVPPQNPNPNNNANICKAWPSKFYIKYFFLGQFNVANNNINPVNPAVIPQNNGNGNGNGNWTWSQNQNQIPTNNLIQTQSVPPQSQPKPNNQYDLSNLNLNVNVESQKIANTQPVNLLTQSDLSKKANMLMNPIASLTEEFDNFQTANTQDKKQSSVFLNFLFYLFINCNTI